MAEYDKIRINTMEEAAAGIIDAGRITPKKLAHAIRERAQAKLVQGANITIDNTDPDAPVISATGGGGGGAVDSVNGETGDVTGLQWQLTEGSGIDINTSTPKSPVISANAQEILDTISTTRGSILYRGASSWEELPPGTDGQVLGTKGPSDDLEWVDQIGGGSISVEQNGVEVVPSASVLNFTGGVSVTDGGSGEAIINITGGGGGVVPTIVQQKAEASANISQGITLDDPPASGNILVAIVFNATNAVPPTTASGWTVLSSNSTAPDHAVFTRRVGPSETAIQVPTSQVDGGAIVMYEVTGTVAVSPESSAGTVTSANVPFTSSAEYLPTSSGLMISYSGRRTDEAGNFTGSTPTDIVLQGSSATTGGTGVSITTGTGPLVLAGSPSASCLWPTSTASKAGFVLIA